MKRLMNKTKGAFAPLMFIALLSGQGFAQSEVDNNKTTENNQSVGWYGGIGFSSVKSVCMDNCEDITFGVIGKVGYDFNQHIGIEGRLIKTMWEYEQQKVEHIGIFAKPMLPINDNLHLYGLLGYAKTKTGDIKVFDDSGIAWGVGVNYFFGDKNEDEIAEGVKKYHFTKADNKEELLEEIKERISLLEQKKEAKDKLREIEQFKELVEEEDNRFGLFLDYERLLQKSDSPDFDSINFGISYDF
ncbi:MAG: porin family protein [Sulfurovaceae bacterium]|nr:porin family protein [Sulfurovaceae bacterium]